MERDQLIWEARAKIIWGESASAIRLFLIESGITEIEADAKIKEFKLERNQEIRKRAIKNICIGMILMIGAVFFTYLLWKHPSPNLSTSRFKGLAGILLVGLYGIWKLLSGIISLLWPQSEKESISDISD